MFTITALYMIAIFPGGTIHHQWTSYIFSNSNWMEYEWNENVQWW